MFAIQRKSLIIWIPEQSSIEGNENENEKAKITAKASDTLQLNITTYEDLKNQIQKLIQIK